LSERTAYENHDDSHGRRQYCGNSVGKDCSTCPRSRCLHMARWHLAYSHSTRNNRRNAFQIHQAWSIPVPQSCTSRVLRGVSNNLVSSRPSPSSFAPLDCHSSPDAHTTIQGQGRELRYPPSRQMDASTLCLFSQRQFERCRPSLMYRPGEAFDGTRSDTPIRP